MSKKLLFATIASVLATGAFADPATITTQDYVDNKFQEKIPAGTDGANGSVVTYGATAGDVQERFILDSETYGDTIKNFVLNGLNFSNNEGFALRLALGKTGEELEESIIPAKYLQYAFKKKQYVIAPGTTGSVVTYNGTDTNRNGGALFSERAIYDGSTTYDSTTDADKLITAGAVDNKQDKMTCTQWLGDEHTDANCLLWSIAN